jgi:hypothetical protein
VMIVGVLAISAAVATERERVSMNKALERECKRYGLSYQRVLAANEGAESEGREAERSWWDYFIIAAALGVFVWLGKEATLPALSMNYRWLTLLVMLLVATAIGFGWALWKKTRFS